MAELSRRDFFRRGLKKATQSVVSYADKKVEQKATQWIRPPFAVNELEFLLSCTRCDACIAACPHDVVFQLPANYGGDVSKTPALDLNNKACHLCEDWPCVNACDANALKFPEPEIADPKTIDSEIVGKEQSITKQDSEQSTEENIEPLMPAKMAWVKITTASCLPYQGPECGACRSSCKIEGALTWDMTKPVINLDLCLGCGMCRQACITDPSAITVHNLALLKQEEQ